jgi:hypothetical protein
MLAHQGAHGMLRNLLRDRRVLLGLAAGILTLVLGGLIWGAFQPWTANHFGYALPGQGGLPSYIHARGRRYLSEQVCAGADWCSSDRAKFGLPRCYTQADLERFHILPLAMYGDMFTLFGAPQPIYVHTGDTLTVTAPFIMADGPDCYVMYDLEGGP